MFEVEKGRLYFDIKGDEGKRPLEFPNYALRVSDLIAKYSMLLA
jgi:hypothetical protein